jgi:hypothetical protein
LWSCVSSTWLRPWGTPTAAGGSSSTSRARQRELPADLGGGRTRSDRCPSGRVGSRSMPMDTTPRRIRRVILVPSFRVAPGRATARTSPTS